MVFAFCLVGGSVSGLSHSLADLRASGAFPVSLLSHRSCSGTTEGNYSIWIVNASGDLNCSQVCTASPLPLSHLLGPLVFADNPKLDGRPAPLGRSGKCRARGAAGRVQICRQMWWDHFLPTVGAVLWLGAQLNASPLSASNNVNFLRSLAVPGPRAAGSFHDAPAFFHTRTHTTYHPTSHYRGKTENQRAGSNVCHGQYTEGLHAPR